MAEKLLEKAQDVFEGQIDFEGQRLAELLSTVILIVAGGISFLVGYIQQDAKLTLFIGLGGAVLAFLVVVPPWPYFNSHPVKWLPKRLKHSEITGIQLDGKKIN